MSVIPSARPVDFVRPRGRCFRDMFQLRTCSVGLGSPCTREQLVILVFLSRTRLEGPMCPLGPLGASARVTKRPVAAAAEPSPRGAHPRSPPPLLPPTPWSGYHGKPHPPPCTAAPLLAGGESHMPSPDPGPTFLWPRVPSSSAPLSLLSLPRRCAGHRGGAQCPGAASLPTVLLSPTCPRPWVLP